MRLSPCLALALLTPLAGLSSEARPPRDDAGLRAWLENMAWHHHYSLDEMSAVLGLKPGQVRTALARFNITPESKPKRPADMPLLVLPYPGGRHPRIGFLEGSVDPQRETKISVFTPWAERDYAVVDVPEAVWSNLGLTYLAHTHVPTVWTKQNVTLPKLEWLQRDNGSLSCERTLPNGIRFGTSVMPQRQGVRMEMWLTNGTNAKLTDLRVQVCVMLKAMAGFEQQDNANKVLQPPYAAARSKDGKRWIITAWQPLHRAWANEKCPCLHSDPKFPDCEPGQTERLHGWFWFYEGEDVKSELARLDKSGWKQDRPRTVRLRGEVLDHDSRKPIPARIYLQDEKGGWHFPFSAAADGSAVYYRRQRRDTASTEMHTTLSAHPFEIDLPPGKYTIIAERGKEWLPQTERITLENKPAEVSIRLRRWSDMAKLGWYSGETHVHRALDELPNVMLAEDLHVALPLTHWVRDAFAAPPSAGLAAKLVKVDETHVFWPINTEYEIFTVNRKPHTLGAFFVLNHRTVFERGVPPVRPIAEQARKEGGLIEMDKHNWPWSMMLVPVIKPDLYELANNHVWRTEFGFPAFGEPAAEYMQAERDRNGFTERGWIDFGFQNYYALLNCGYRLRPTAGTASGVHPVPLGYGRVYVDCPDGFSYEAWMKGLNAGRSFVTTGPMLRVRVNGQPPGHPFNGAGDYRIIGNISSSQPLKTIEIVVNGEVVRRIKPGNKSDGQLSYETLLDEKLAIGSSSWIAVRCFEAPPGRVRFAHGSPVFIDVEGKPLRPRTVETDYLIRRVEEQLKRNKGVLPAEAIEEYEQALRAYQEAVRTAR